MPPTPYPKNFFDLQFSQRQHVARKWMTKIGIVLVLLTAWAATPKTPFLFTALIGAFTLITLLYTHHAAMCVQWPSARQRMRWIRNTRRFFAATPLVRFLYSSAFLASSLSLLLMFSTGWNGFASIGGFVAMTCCVITFPIDFYSRFAWLLKYPTIKKATYALLGFSATATLFIAHILGKKIAEDISGVDAKYLSDFVQITAVIAYPFALLGVINVIAAMVLTMETITVYVLIFCTQIKQFLFGFLNHPTRQRIENSFYRLATGKKLRKKLPFWFRTMNNFHLFFRAFAPGAFVAFFGILLFGSLELMRPVSGELLRKSMVLIEFKPNNGCANLSSLAPILKLDDNQVSIASKSAHNRTVFTTVACEKSPPLPVKP